MIAPLGIVSFRATSNIKADGSVFGISFTTAVYIVGDDKGKVLEILGVGRWVDVEVDYCIPLLAIGYYVILGESRPKAGSKIRFSESVHIFQHALKHFVFRLFLRIFNFLYLIGNPVGALTS